MVFQGPAGGRRIEVIFHFHKHFSSSRPVVTAAMFWVSAVPTGLLLQGYSQPPNCAWHGRLYACRNLGPRRRAEPCPRSQMKDNPLHYSENFVTDCP